MSTPTDRLTAMGLIRNHDGSFTRAAEPPVTPALSNLDDDRSTKLLTKDVPLNRATNTSVRLFLPRTALDGTAKLPIIIYAHGGGFIILRAASTVCHHFCSTLALRTPALIVSVDYRLAPEHRLPAAYDDFMEAMQWAGTSNDEWLTKYADLSNCYLMGSSAGGNVAFHAGLRAASCANVKIKGVVLHQPFFGGVERTPSEIKSAENMTLPLPVSDVMWELALPVGADRDHEYCNPMKGKVRESFDMIKDKGWKVMVTGCGGDTLYDRQMEVVKAMREKGVTVENKFVEGEYHGYDILEPSKAELIFSAVKEIIS